MINKSISINKQSKRLFNGPIDPTLTWETYAELEAYLLNPTCYVNQILGCNGLAYIITEDESGLKILKEIGLNEGGGDDGGGVIPNNIIELLEGKANLQHRHDATDIDGLIPGGDGTIVVAGYHIGPEPPTNTKLLWIDTTDSQIDLSFPSIVIDELRSIITNMNSQIRTLINEVEYLKQGTIIVPPVIPDDEYALISEDGYVMITEDGYTLVNEYITAIEPYNLLTEDGYVMITEDGDMLTIDDTITDNFITEDGYVIITESGYTLVNEDMSSIINELLTEDEYVLMTEDGYTLVNEDTSSSINNLLLTEDLDNLLTEDEYNLINEAG